jgi:hypothetical protein
VGECFWRQKGVACVPVAGGIAKLNRRTRRTCALSDLTQNWSIHESVYVSRSGWVNAAGWCSIRSRPFGPNRTPQTVCVGPMPSQVNPLLQQDLLQ